MPQDYLVNIREKQITIPSTAGLREKWTGAMLDPTGRAYAGAIRIDFSLNCDKEKVINIVTDTLAQFPILAAQFKMENDILVGYAPKESVLRETLKEHLSTEDTCISDEAFLSYCATKASDPGLRLASNTDDTGFHLWVGFWIYTCDGASIDLLIDEIANRYMGRAQKSFKSWTEYTEVEINQSLKREKSKHSDEVYPVPGPYGIDAVRATPRVAVGQSKSVQFSSSVPRSMVLTCARAYRVTPFVLLFAAYQHAISAVSEKNTIITGVPFVNRQNPDDFTVVGPLSNTIPITTHHKSHESLASVVNKVQHAVLEAAGRQSLEIAALYPEGITSRNVGYDLPFPQLFNAWNSQREGAQISLGNSKSMRLSLLPNDTYRAGFEITLDDSSEYISGRIDMDTQAYGKFADKVIEQMMAGLKSLN
ncbi:Condensation domain-containing protein [Halobacillus karajensis]|uniref:condensation domain-containing protein n=1 Tax=Halobacillus karajensis TaxID=195088 RepID=UPI0008A79054|nr:condensation domain-containing protein [Halobacillus karajensis]SEH77177.1 Condensation domain-containing protein [Halobacillus karajensis]